MKRKQTTLKETIQKFYLTFNSFMANGLFTYAASGAYSFFLSALPIVLMVLVVLLRIMKESPDTLRDFLTNLPYLSSFINIESFIISLAKIKSIGLFELIIGFSIFWMARRFFASIQQGMRHIYKKRGKSKPVKENLLVIAGEILLIILITITTTTIIAGRAFFSSTLSEAIFDPVLRELISHLLRFIPSLMLCLFLFLIYYIMPRTRPQVQTSAFVAISCTVSFLVVQFIFASFINMSKYNLVYGFLSNIIVLLLEVYLFFVLMLFFAQFQYVHQFFDSFLLAELYLLPQSNTKNLIKKIERALFIEVPYLYKKYVVLKPQGTVLFNQGDTSKEIYYIYQGTVSLLKQESATDYEVGSIFGEFSSILHIGRTATAICKTDCELLALPEQLFLETIEVDGEFSRRTLLTIADYVQGSVERFE